MDVGDVVTVSWPIEVAAPDTVTLTVTAPDGGTVTVTAPGGGTVTTPTVTLSVSPQVATATVTLTTAGLWRLAWSASTGQVMVDSVHADPVSLPPIASVADLTALTRDLSTTSHDRVRESLTIASALCEQHTRVWRRQTVTQSHDVETGQRCLWLRRPVISVTSVVEAGTAVASDGWTLDGASGRLWRGSSRVPLAWESGAVAVTTVHVAGEVSGVIPSPVRHGVAVLAAHLLQRWRGASGLPRMPDVDGGGTPSWVVPRAVMELWQPWLPTGLGQV